jgi:hypothetical protein
MEALLQTSSVANVCWAVLGVSIGACMQCVCGSAGAAGSLCCTWQASMISRQEVMTSVVTVSAVSAASQAARWLDHCSKYGCLQVERDTPETRYITKRSPAWCDRVLVRSNLPHKQATCVDYYSAPQVDTSDHKPVGALLKVCTGLLVIAEPVMPSLLHKSSTDSTTTCHASAGGALLCLGAY